MTDADGEPMTTAAASWLAPELPIEARATIMLSGALEEASAPLVSVCSNGRYRPPVVAVVLGISEDRPGMPAHGRQVLTDAVRQSLQGSLALGAIELCGSGHAAGMIALQRGSRLLLDGQAEFCLVGGVDSHLHPENLLALERQGRIHGESNPWGLVPGEGAGCCLLTTQATADRYRLGSLLQVVSVSAAREPNTLGSKGVCTGAGLSQAVAEVLKSCPAEKVDVIVSDQTGEPYRADEFGFTVARHARRFSVPPVFLTPGSSWGDVGAASVPLFLVLVVASGQRGYAKGEYGLLLASSDTDQRGAALVWLPAGRRSEGACQ
jgi:3-oxoacyl-[acyl-carrier-protein] synthase-1